MDGRPAAGAVLAAGTGRTITVEFTPADRVNQRQMTATVTIDVTPAPLVVTADDQTKVYGGAIPALTASYSGFVNGDTSASLATPPTLSTTATSASHVSGSPYPITVAGAADANYAISYVAGALTVTPAPLTITANNQTVVYGAALPTLTATYSGLVNGDDAGTFSTDSNIAPTLIATASVGNVSAQPYAIIPTIAYNPDYTIDYVPGTLTVTPMPATLSFGGLVLGYNGSAQAAPIVTNPAGISDVTIVYTRGGTEVAPPSDLVHIPSPLPSPAPTMPPRASPAR